MYYQTVCLQVDYFLIIRCYFRYLYETNSLPEATLNLIQASQDPVILDILAPNFDPYAGRSSHHVLLMNNVSANELNNLQHSLSEHSNLAYDNDKLKNFMKKDTNLFNRVVDIAFKKKL